MTVEHVRISLLVLEFLGADLNLVSLLIVFLLRKVCLDLPKVEKFSRVFECHRKPLLKLASLIFKCLCVGRFESHDLCLVFFLGLSKLVIPVRVEVLVLLDVGLLTLFALLLMGEKHFFHLSRVFLLLELGDPVLSHLSFNILTVRLASVSMLLQCSTIRFLLDRVV